MRQEADAAAKLATLTAALDADAASVMAARATKAAAVAEIDELGRRHLLELMHAQTDVASGLRSLQEALAALGNGATTASFSDSGLGRKKQGGGGGTRQASGT